MASLPESLVREYRRRTPKSAALAERAGAVSPIPNSRSSVQHAPYALTLTRGEGTWLWDADGNRYVDLVSNLFSLIHGNAYAPVVEAAKRQLERGSVYPGNHEPHVALAEQLTARMPAVEQIMFFNSGTEAFSQALSVARGVTGRYKFLMAATGYHGSGYDTYLGTYGLPGPSHFLARYGDADSFKAVLQAHGHEIAAVVLEPILGAGGVVTPPADFLPEVYRAAKAAGALFIVDEVVTFRVAFGGAQASLPFRPDLVMLGKVIGGGFPVGAVGGSKEVMETYLRHPSGVVGSGTFCGNPVTMAAGAVAVRDLTASQIERINGMTEGLGHRLRDLAQAHGLAMTVRQAGSILALDFGESQSVLAPAVQLAALNHGLLMSARGNVVVNTAMQQSDMDRVREAFDAAFAQVSSVLVH